MSMPSTPDSATAVGESRRVTDIAIRYTTVRYRCPHCRRSYAHQKTADKHIARCFRNPAVRSCKSCRFYGLTVDGFSCDRFIDLSGAFCPVCGAVMLPDGSGGCDHNVNPVYNLRVQCASWEAS